MTEKDKNPHCCLEMARHLEKEEASIVYNDRHREYGILSRWDYNESVSKHSIDYCPWCGAKLPPGLSKQWFGLLEELGLEPEDPRVPKDMKSDAWWRKRGL